MPLNFRYRTHFVNRGVCVKVHWESVEHGRRFSVGVCALHSRSGIAITQTLLDLNAKLRPINKSATYTGPLDPNEECLIIPQNIILAIVALEDGEYYAKTKRQKTGFRRRPYRRKAAQVHRDVRVLP